MKLRSKAAAEFGIYKERSKHASYLRVSLIIRFNQDTRHPRSIGALPIADNRLSSLLLNNMRVNVTVTIRETTMRDSFSVMDRIALPSSASECFSGVHRVPLQIHLRAHKSKRISLTRAAARYSMALKKKEEEAKGKHRSPAQVEQSQHLMQQLAAKDTLEKPRPIVLLSSH